MTQEHGRVEPISGKLDYSLYPLGSLLTLIPYHVSVLVSCLISLSSFLLFYSLFFCFFLAVLCDGNDASCVSCTLEGHSCGQVDTNTWMVKRWKWWTEFSSQQNWSIDFFFLSANTMQVNKCSILCEFKLLFFNLPISPKQLLFIIDSKRLYLLLYFSKSLM